MFQVTTHSPSGRCSHVASINPLASVIATNQVNGHPLEDWYVFEITRESPTARTYVDLHGPFASEQEALATARLIVDELKDYSERDYVQAGV